MSFIPFSSPPHRLVILSAVVTQKFVGQESGDRSLKCELRAEIVARPLVSSPVHIGENKFYLFGFRICVFAFHFTFFSCHWPQRKAIERKINHSPSFCLSSFGNARTSFLSAQKSRSPTNRHPQLTQSESASGNTECRKFLSLFQSSGQ